MKFISDTKSIESNRESFIKKGYVKIFIVGIILIIVGFITLSIILMILSISYDDLDYENYTIFIRLFASISRLFLQVGFVLFILSFFIGGLTDITISENIRKNLLIASGIAMFALTILIIYSTTIIYY